MSRIDVRKTYKLYIGGAFPRSESGHSYVVNDAKGTFLANAALASRKDARDAVVAARKAFGGWSGRTAYNRGQVLYRVAEVMEDRRPQFVEAVRQSEGLTAGPGRAGRRRSDRPAGLVRRLGRQDHPGRRQRQPGRRPVLQPLHARADRRRRGPRAAGVLAARPGQRRRPGRSSPATRSSWSSSYDRPLPAVTLAEVLATSDVPGGVVNILTGSAAEIAPWLASHMDVNAIDLTGVAGDAELATALEVAAAENLKRVRRAPAAEPDWTADPGIDRDDGVPRDQDGLAPDRRLTARARQRDRPGRPLRGRQVAARRAARPAGAAARRLLQERRRPDAPPDHRRARTPGSSTGTTPTRGCSTTRWRAARAAVPRGPGRGAGLRHRPRRPHAAGTTLDLGGHDLFVAEGIFAQEVVGAVPRAPACSPRRTACASTRS